MLSNPNFLNKAPEHKVQDEKDAERQKVLEQKEADRLKKLKYRCQTLGIKELDVTVSKIFQKVEKRYLWPRL